MSIFVNFSLVLLPSVERVYLEGIGVREVIEFMEYDSGFDDRWVFMDGDDISPMERASRVAELIGDMVRMESMYSVRVCLRGLSERVLAAFFTGVALSDAASYHPSRTRWVGASYSFFKRIHGAVYVFPHYRVDSRTGVKEFDRFLEF